MSFRNSPWSGRPREGYFLMRLREKLNSKSQETCILKACTSKDEAEKALEEYEKADIAVWIEDMEGNRLS